MKINWNIPLFKPENTVTSSLLVIIILVHLSSLFFPNLLDYGSMDPLYIWEGQYYRLVTCIFLHGGLLHIAFNSYALWILGSIMERVLGRRFYIWVFFLSGLSGSLASLMFVKGISVGASGAIFGLIGSGLVIEYRMKGLKQSVFLSLAIINIVLGFIIPHIDNAGHIGGLIGGGLVTLFIVNQKTSFLTKSVAQKIYIGAIVGYILCFLYAFNPSLHKERMYILLYFKSQAKSITDLNNFERLMNFYDSYFDTEEWENQYFRLKAIFHWKLGRKKRAIEFLEKALISSPEDQSLYTALYQMYLELNMKAQAEQTLKMLEQLKSKKGGNN